MDDYSVVVVVWLEVMRLEVDAYEVPGKDVLIVLVVALERNR